MHCPIARGDTGYANGGATAGSPTALLTQVNNDIESLINRSKGLVDKVRNIRDRAITILVDTKQSGEALLAVTIPVIASGGAGTVDHFVEVFQQGQADAALAASIFHYKEITLEEVKTKLREEGVPVRPIYQK